MQTKIHEHFYSAKFVKHVSDEMPWAARNEFVEVKLRNGDILVKNSNDIDWDIRLWDFDVVEYSIIPRNAVGPIYSHQGGDMPPDLEPHTVVRVKTRGNNEFSRMNKAEYYIWHNRCSRDWHILEYMIIAGGKKITQPGPEFIHDGSTKPRNIGESELVEIKINNSEKFYGPVSPEMVNWNNKSRRADSQVTHYRIFVPHEAWQDRVYQSINEQLLPSIISEISSIDAEIAKLTERRSVLMKQLLSTYM